MDNQNSQASNNPLEKQLYEQSKTNLEKKIAYDKLIGYLLLIGGLFMILLGLFLVFNTLTGKFKPPQVSKYELPQIELALPAASIQVPEGTQLPEGFRMPTTASSTKLQIPNEIINDLIGISFYYLLMMFLASSGYKIASIGVKMIKDIKVKV